MPDSETTHTVAWFYQMEELEAARREAKELRARARVWWGDGLLQGEAYAAELRAAELENELGVQHHAEQF